MYTAQQVAVAVGTIEPDAVHRAAQRGNLERRELPQRGKKKRFGYTEEAVKKVWPEADFGRVADESIA